MQAKAHVHSVEQEVKRDEAGPVYAQIMHCKLVHQSPGGCPGCVRVIAASLTTGDLGRYFR